MSRSLKTACLAAALLCVGTLAMADGLGLTVGVCAGFGDVLSDISIEVTPYVEWAHSFGIIDFTLHGEYTKSFDAGSGAGSALVSEDLSLGLGDSVSVTAELYNENSYSFEGEGLSGYLEPSVEVGLGVFYARVGVPFDYLPDTNLAAYGTVGAAGDAWTVEATVDLGVSGGVSIEDVVLYADASFSILTLSVAATVPGTFTFDSVTLSPEVDVYAGALTVAVGADVWLGSGPLSVSPWVDVSFAF